MWGGGHGEGGHGGEHGKVERKGGGEGKDFYKRFPPDSKQHGNFSATIGVY